ncbi:hypothetical protein GCM10022631_11930 [Deinococcus rubellus]|uniref:Uncharacterized protein n=1 Tax=Deinococcus rubellus TaxID=1889240 RepID=A0ABY5YDG5_9DEIO|nr:hypothetical protein [Deinococcus rubellus]UWX62761.1 hypothetical protein N0D28_08240 [Deinococcus rubellus]
MSADDLPVHYKNLLMQYETLRRDHQRYLKRASQAKKAHEKAALSLAKIPDPAAKKEAVRLMQIARGFPGEIEAELLEARWGDFPALEDILGGSN